MTRGNFQTLANFIWSVADLLRGPYRPPQYERVMLPLTLLRRFDAVLAPTKETVLQRYESLKSKDSTVVDKILNELAKDAQGITLGFHNHSQLDFKKLKGDPDNVGRHLVEYINSFSENIRNIFERFEFDKEIEKMEEANRLYQVVAQFAEIDLHPDIVDNITMGLVFEDLIRRFNESANETAGDHFTPREVIRLMVNLLLAPDTEVLTLDGIIVTICDPACGTGGMLAESQNWIHAHNERATIKVYGQDYNPRSYAVAASDLLIKGHRDSKIEYGDTLTSDPFDKMPGFDYLLANPPFGVDWKGQKKTIEQMASFYGYKGKLPRVNDGSLLFLLYMIDKFQPWSKGDPHAPGSRMGIVFNGSPLFTGSAGGGESEIRRWVMENDWLEAIIALPEQMFYNTGIGTFIWVLSNRKEKARKKKIQLIDARDQWVPMKRSLGNKRRFIDENTIAMLTTVHGNMETSSISKVYDSKYFGYRRVGIQRPLRLKFQMTFEAKEHYLDTFPEMLDTVLAVEAALGTEPYGDWNDTWLKIQKIIKTLPDDRGWEKGAKGTAQKKGFRDAFTTVDPQASPVVAKVHKDLKLDFGELFPGQVLPELSFAEKAKLLGLHAVVKGKYIEFEVDSALKDFENIPLYQDVISYVQREVLPYVPDAWIDPALLDEHDGGIGKVGYEINFNREFFQYTPPRPLVEIDSELEAVEQRIMELLRGVTE